MSDHYQTLGISRSASPEDIKRAYRKLASQHHPDKGGDTQRFQQIQQAYDVLSDPAQRQAYDNPRPQAGHFQQNFNFDDIFSMFGVHHAAHRQRRPQARYSFWIALYDVAVGGMRTITINTGQGIQGIDIEVPLGINDGDSVQYPNIGPGGSDLIIQYRVRPDAVWERRGLDITSTVKLSIWDLLLGAKITVKDVKNRMLELDVPARTQPGAMLRLKSQGLKDRHGNTGDAYVRIEVYIPEHIPDEILEVVQKHKK